MIDIFWTKASLFSSILCMFFLTIYALRYMKTVLYEQFEVPYFTVGQYVFAFLLVLFFCPDGDFFHYQNNVWYFNPSNNQYYWEDFYNFLVPFCHYNYLVFRIIVWGGAFIITNISFKRLEINQSIANYILVICFIITFNYARATLAFASYFLGLTFLIKPINYKRIISYVIVAISFYCTYAFHHSSLVLVLLTPLAFLPLNKKTLILILIFLPVAARYVGSYLFQYVELNNGDEYLQGKLFHYFEVETVAATWKGYIKLFISYCSFFLPIVISSIAYFNNKDYVEPYIKAIVKITIGVTVFSVMFLFMGIENTVMFYRILYMTLIGSIISFTYFYQNCLISVKQFYLVLVFGFVNNLYTMMITIMNL